MRGLLFARVNFSKPENGGIHLKCLGQLDALRSASTNVDFLYFLSDGLYLNEKKIYDIAPKKMKERLYLAKLYLLDLGKTIATFCDLKDYDFLYFRYCLSSRALLHFLKSFKKANPSSKIISDFPTYPYEQEYRSIPRMIELKLDQFYRKKVFALVDRVAHLGEELEIYNTAVLSIGNGINVDDFPQASTNTDWNELRLIAVGNFNYWHGLDRLIFGINQYKGDKDIKVRIIGKNWEEAKSLCAELGVDSIFQFYSPLSKSELDAHYAWANFGIGTLAIHRKGVTINQSLKHREYAARGLNFVYAGNDPGFSKTCSGILNINETDEPIAIDLLSKNLENHNSTIKAHARNYLSWKIQLEKVMNFIKAN